jgi:hypothetical protein
MHGNVSSQADQSSWAWSNMHIYPSPHCKQETAIMLESSMLAFFLGKVLQPARMAL